MVSTEMSRRRLAAMLALGFLPALPANALSLPDPPPLTAQTGTLGLVRRLTVQVRINDQGPYPFLVDTGANASVISSELAATLGLPVGAPVNLHGIAGVELVGTVTAATVGVGRRVRRDLTLSVLPGRFIQAPGILGLDWLGSQGLILDFARNQMRLGSISPMTDEMTVSVPIKARRNGLHLIEASVAGASVLAFLDTGSTTTVGNAALMAQAIRLRSVTTDWADIELQSLTGQTITGRLAALRTVSLGKVTLGNVPVVFGPIHTFAYWGLVDRPAILIGMDILNAFESVALDFNRGQVYFRLSSSSTSRETAMS
ncbi:putative aspartyl protease [Caulobacter sp. AP07]|uniref:retroviral-like aspartic protease family protein n=1 Tax=Caulobacter sp. AP07 TaxID=1144304 RepID=UPI000271E825|nr:retroviral-like aspartic protease family protein [Caulobacter sp. AP07]EJL37713.1 putative aspartyl protease [Caulobacter sp. AP07]